MVFQDDFIPRGKITKDGNYSIISDYLGTPVEAYDEEGKKVWKRNLDIYGRVKTEEALGKKNFIHFVSMGSMRMKKPSCTITDSGTMIRSRDSIRSRIRLD